MPAARQSALRPASADGDGRLRVAVDLTQSEARNSLGVRCVEALARYAPEVEFLIVQRRGAHAGLAGAPTSAGAATQATAGPNLRTVVVAEPSPAARVLARVRGRASREFEQLLRRQRHGVLPGLAQAVDQLRPDPLRRLRPNVVLAPFVGSGRLSPRLPLVAAVHDVQHLSHPYLLDPDQRTAHARSLATVQQAQRLLCSAPSVRDSLTDHGVPAERLAVARPARLLYDLATPPPDPAPAPPIALRSQPYCLSVGDLEPRQNHRVLLTAFGMFGARHPDSALELRCVVPSAESAARLRALVAALQLDTRVAVVHSTRPSEVEALVAHSCAVIVPALYETVGEPIVQALAWGRPLLCSALPDLLDLADGAAVGFDPHQPTALLAVLEDLDQHPAVLESLAQRSRARWASLEGPETVARAFVQALQGAAC